MKKNERGRIAAFLKAWRKARTAEKIAKRPLKEPCVPPLALSCPDCNGPTHSDHDSHHCDHCGFTF